MSDPDDLIGQLTKAASTPSNPLWGPAFFSTGTGVLISHSIPPAMTMSALHRGAREIFHGTDAPEATAAFGAPLWEK